MAQLEMEIHPHLVLRYTCSIHTYHYEIWMERVLFQLDALLLSVKKIMYKLLKLYTRDSLVAAVRLVSRYWKIFEIKGISFCKILIFVENFRLMNFYNKLISIYILISGDINHGSTSFTLNQDSKKKFTMARILKVRFGFPKKKPLTQRPTHTTRANKLSNEKIFF